MRSAEEHPAEPMTLDLQALSVQAGGQTVEVSMAPAVREAFRAGTWDATGLLLDQSDYVRAVAAKLPYLTGF